jgi:uncharacterized OB-fold protein
MSQITAYKCKSCDLIMYPKHDRCMQCGKRDFREIKSTDSASLLTFTVLNELPWGIDERGRVLGIVEFSNGIRALGIINEPEETVTLGMKLKAGWGPVRVIGGERVYGLVFQAAE